MHRLVGALLLLVLAAPALADKRDYARGVEAAEDGDWAKVQQLMGGALAADAEPSDRALMYGTYRRPYIPQYYLALAAVNRNDCAAAMRMLGDARLAALLATGGRAAAEATEVGTIRKRCATPLSTAQTPEPTPPDTTAPPAPTLSAAQRQSAQRAIDALQLATTQAQAKVPLAQLSPALTQSAQAKAALENAVLSGESANLQRALALATTATAELSRLTRSAGTVAQVPNPPPATTPTPPVPTKVAPAAGLQSALASFLAGDYNSVQRASTAGMDPRSAGHTLLLRAAARYSLFLLSGERDASLRTLAEVDVREARRALASIRASSAFFSPRFVSFFERTR